jgi:phage terminase large subunit
MPTQINIDTTKTFQNLLDSKNRVSQHIGGTRSGKTYAILQFLLVKMIEQDGINITVVRKSIPVLKRSVIKDFTDILKSLGIWNEDEWNGTDRIWRYYNSTIQFISTDDADKLRGIKSDILFIDEASEIDEESYFQLSIRTTGRIILAYNPTVSPYHWLRQMVDVDRFITTYKDNPYLPKEMVYAIEELEIKNPKYWKIYGKGEFAPNDRAIFNFDIVDSIDADFVGFGIDFGFSSDPTALVAVYKNSDTIFLEELIYEKGLVTNDIVDRLRKLDIQKSEEIWGDSAEPRLIEEIYRSGFNIKPVVKGKDSIKFGIGVMQNYNIKLLKTSQNLINEMYAYQYSADKYGYVTDTPEGGLDHLIDAARYCCMMKLSQKATQKGKYAITIGNIRY